MRTRLNITLHVHYVSCYCRRRYRCVAAACVAKERTQSTVRQCCSIGLAVLRNTTRLTSIQLALSLNQRFPYCKFQPLCFSNFCLLILRTQPLLRRPCNEALHIISFCFDMQVHPLSPDLTNKKHNQSIPITFPATVH